MSYEIPCMSYVTLYVVSMHIIQTNSKTHWKLNLDIGKVQPSEEQEIKLTGPYDEDVMDILHKQFLDRNSDWEISATGDCENMQCNLYDQQKIYKDHHAKNQNKTQSREFERQADGAESSSFIALPTVEGRPKTKSNVLSCGKPVNVTEYDSLRGVMHRNTHPSMPEPDVAMVFRKTGSHNNEIDMDVLEKTLRKAKKEKPKSAQVYNQIGNFWRIKGNTQLSIECFRKALYLNPHHADVLLNLARVLFNLHFLDDAIYLTRRSLEMLAPDHNSWLQHFTLGEILKAYGHFHEAKLHFQRTLELNPAFQPAASHLREMDKSPDSTVTYYTLLIILMLVLIVLCGILSSTDGLFEESCDNSKTKRHFNRAMAMRSIKLGINPKLIKMRKQMAQACN